MQRHDTDLLAAKFKQGELKPFEDLVKILSRQLIALAYRYTLDLETARDLTQETWLTVYQHINQYDTERPFVHWISAILRNRCKSYLRRPAVRREHAAGEDLIELLDSQSDRGDPLRDLERREFELRLREAIDRLTASQQRVLLLVDLEQGDQAETARILGMNHSTLRSTLHFARRRLARILLEMEENVWAAR